MSVFISGLLLDLPVSGYETGLDAELVRRELHGLLGNRFRHAFDLEQDAARLDHRDPALRVALALAHTGFERLLGVGLVREDPDPDLAAALDVPRDGDSAGLDLPRGDPRRLESLQGEIAESDRVAALAHAGAPPAVLLS